MLDLSDSLSSSQVMTEGAIGGGGESSDEKEMEGIGKLLADTHRR